LTTKQREVIQRYTTATLLRLLVPGNRWRRRILPVDQPLLGSLRRRAMLLIGIGAALGFSVFWGIGREDPPAGADLPIAQRPTVPTEPSVSLPGPTPAEATVSARATTRSEAPGPSLAEKRSQPALFSTAKVTAVYEGHDVRGVRIEKVGPGSFWNLVGVRNGDVVIAHNGARIDTPTAMVALLNSMERDVVIRLRVRGTDDDERTLYYSAPR